MHSHKETNNGTQDKNKTMRDEHETLDVNSQWLSSDRHWEETRGAPMGLRVRIIKYFHEHINDTHFGTMNT